MNQLRTESHNVDKFLVTCVNFQSAKNDLGTVCLVQDLGSSSEHQYRDMSVDKKGNRVATPSRNQIALAEMKSVANQEPRLKNYLTTQRHACYIPVEPPIRRPQILKYMPSIDDKGQLPVPAKALDMHRAYPNHHLDISQFKWK
ncbi:uncharacterized protein LOC134841189 [Symsagittifera roscoffensis]|uniref:uncharacterized protein LOC134841189 n=1 Tax=Symsagittifera roscoffensis TaxID=84072 RepID=UPI00307C8991